MVQSIPFVEVVAAVIIRPDGRFLLTSRPEGKPYAGYWEFPGGKIEAGESALQAITRELQEELGIQVEQVYPWITRVFTYTHATVRLHFYRVVEWYGQPFGRENQALSWQTVDNVSVIPLLPANLPVIRGLALPPVYAITNASELGEEAMLCKLEHAFQQGLKLLQIREKSMTNDRFRWLASEIIRRAHTFQARVVINSDISLSRELGADGVHLTSAQLMSLTKRPDVNWCGASCHNAEELYQAESIGMDFVVLGPLLPTLSHPGLPVLGWRKFSSLVRDYSLPVYALGGLVHADLAIALEQGGHGIAMMRDIWVGE
ncbi:Nudix family hydrolase [Nitrosomonas sp. Nm132]|uniref:Nudix family hydrolase n=1 Tax=Nitrosomonas sp. Nm132 TaxID=1881053 RepID=UPI0008883E61|nr:Nudix family hydrolase [Nitrosomonas sp. Nm132]SDG89927.1 8-oxo-dGTP diphosphatase [Nitrosomonas sp. Nm132]